jgi:acyl-CoA thioester hydrolase
MSSDWQWLTRDTVRWADVDAMGHVNNAVFSTYIEQARIEALGGLESFILARVEIDFRDQVRVGETVEVRTRCSRIGTKSLDLEHEVVAGGRLAAEAKSVLVGFDYESESSVELSDDVRARLTAVPGTEGARH